MENGKSIAAVARTLGVVDQTLFNWVKAHQPGKRTGAHGKAPVRAELARVKMEGYIPFWEKRRRTSQEGRFELGLH